MRGAAAGALSAVDGRDRPSGKKGMRKISCGRRAHRQGQRAQTRGIQQVLFCSLHYSEGVCCSLIMFSSSCLSLHVFEAVS